MQPLRPGNPFVRIDRADSVAHQRESLGLLQIEAQPRNMLVSDYRRGAELLNRALRGTVAVDQQAEDVANVKRSAVARRPPDDVDLVAIAEADLDVTLQRGGYGAAPP